MPVFVANKMVKMLIGKGNPVKGSRALILGIAFKENCPDIRNSKVAQIATELNGFGIATDVHDPWAHPDHVQHEFGIRLLPSIPKEKSYDAVLLAVAHREFLTMDLRSLLRDEPKGIVYDIKAVVDRSKVDGRL
jgi:UDP-N-acetyl-D-galactosamine dehydrogenase